MEKILTAILATIAYVFIVFSERRNNINVDISPPKAHSDNIVKRGIYPSNILDQT